MLPAYAQQAPVIIVGQGQLFASSTAGSSSSVITFTYKIGAGYTGSSTEAVLAVHTPAGQINENPSAVVDIEQFSDPNYSNSVGFCRWESNFSGYQDGLLELQIPGVSSGVGCVISPANYVTVTGSVITNTGFGINGTWLYGSTNNIHNWNVVVVGNSNFYPFFDVIGNGFTLEASSTASALDLSGASAFCNQQFGTSSSIASDFGAAICTAVGFLFIPSQASITQFADIPTGLSQKAPFSWVFQTIGTWDSLTATTTENVPQYSIDLAATGIGSTTALGDILPTQMDLLSSSTINKYLPAGVHDTLFALAGFAIDLTAVGYMFRRVMGLFTLES